MKGSGSSRLLMRHVEELPLLVLVGVRDVHLVDRLAQLHEAGQPDLQRGALEVLEAQPVPRPHERPLVVRRQVRQPRN